MMAAFSAGFRGPEITVRPRDVLGVKLDGSIQELKAACIENDPSLQRDAGRKVLAKADGVWYSGKRAVLLTSAYMGTVLLNLEG